MQVARGAPLLFDVLVDALDLGGREAEGRADFRRATASVVESLKKRVDPKLIEAVVTEAAK